MPYSTPEEVIKKAISAYPRFLKHWISESQDAFFPLRLRVNLKLDVSQTGPAIASVQRLLEKSKERRGWGYTVHCQEKRPHGFGSNQLPVAVSIDTLDDLLRLTGKRKKFERTERVVSRVREELPQLEEWLVSNRNNLWRYAESIEGLIAVTQYFLLHPWPDCYARQIAVAVDTKFIERHQAVLRQWLDSVLPANAIDVNENRFQPRFGLRYKGSHSSFRVLDSALQAELGLRYDELSLPLRLLAELDVRDACIFIVENELPMLTLPAKERGLAIFGRGFGVNALQKLDWLDANVIHYWGDIDVDGFRILSMLRNRFPHVRSLLMDWFVLEEFMELTGVGNGSQPATPTNLTSAETTAFEYCRTHDLRLEQEKLPQPYVERTLAVLESM
jgi:hypothetical protein